jgi:hypothetical protein
MSILTRAELACEILYFPAEGVQDSKIGWSDAEAMGL